MSGTRMENNLWQLPYFLPYFFKKAMSVSALK